MLTHAEPPPRTESSTEWRLTGKAGLRDGEKRKMEKNENQQAASVKPPCCWMQTNDVTGWRGSEGEDNHQFYHLDICADQYLSTVSRTEKIIEL